jgi:hypothetical protein
MMMMLFLSMAVEKLKIVMMLVSHCRKGHKCTILYEAYRCEAAAATTRKDVTQKAIDGEFVLLRTVREKSIEKKLDRLAHAQYGTVQC